MLREEVDRGTISASEYVILPTYFRRTSYYLKLILAGRLEHWSRARKVHRAAVGLAFTKRLVRSSWALPEETSVRMVRNRVARRRSAREAAH